MSSIKEYFKQEGRIEGIQEGRKKVLKRGLNKGPKGPEYAKNGESTEKVALYTGLPEEKITNLYTQLIKNNGKNGIRK